MNDTARRLRAQKAYSTDPAYLERMARQEETGVYPTKDAAAEDGRPSFASAAIPRMRMATPLPQSSGENRAYGAALTPNNGVSNEDRVEGH